MTKKLTLTSEISKVLACSPSERGRSIIDSPYTKQIMEQLPPQETYLIIRESWGTDSQILLQYVPPEAVCHFIDLDCWEGETFSVEAVIEWLAEIYNASFESLIQALETLDLEILVLLFQTYLEVVHVRPTDEHIPELIDEGFESLDNMYFYRMILEDDHSHFIKEMLSILFTSYQDLYYTILEGVMYELKTSMEETTFEKRSLRLMEMGFPQPDDAMSVYRRIRPEKLLRQGMLKEKIPIINKHMHMLPTVYLEQFSRGFLVNSLENTSAETRERFLYEMIYLANKVLMADYKPLNNSNEIKRSMEKASSLATLGLGIAVKEKGLTAEAVLNEINAETLFSLGLNMVYEQQRRLRLVLEEVEAAMIPERFREHMDGLMKKRPLFKDKDFSSIHELEEITGVVDGIEAMSRIMSALKWADEIPNLAGTNTGAGLDMETIILTSLGVNASTGQSRFRPLVMSELLGFLSLVTRVRGSQRKLVPSFDAELQKYLLDLHEDLDRKVVADIATTLATRVEEELGGVKDLNKLDSRFITCFTVRLAS